MTRKKGVMEIELARSVLEQISALDLTEKVTFHVMGEPLLHPNFFEILDFAQQKGLKVGLTTNGGLLNSDSIKRLADRDLHQIDISLQTPDRESFEATRGARVDFDKYCENLLELMAACAARTSPPIFKIRFMTTRFAGKMTKHLGIPNFMKTTGELHRNILRWTERVCFRLGRPIPDDLPQRIRKIGICGWNVIEISPKIYFETYVLTDWGNAFAPDGVVEVNRGYCFGMRDHFGILYSGDVVLCCVDFDGKTSIGNLKESSLLDILSGSRLKKIMSGFATGRLVEPYCRHCLGSSTRLGALIKPAASLMGLKVLKPFFYRKYRLF